MSMPNINPKQVASVLQEVSESFKSVSTSSGHRYVMIDPKTNEVRATFDKRQAASFREISGLVTKILSDRTLTSEEKGHVLRDYKNITDKFEGKKLGFWASLFFGFTKSAQVTDARAIHLINTCKKMLEESGELKEKLKELQNIKRELYLLESQLKKLSVDDTRIPELKSQRTDKNEKFSQLQTELHRGKEFRKQMKSILEEIKILDNDAPAVKAAKEKVSNKNRRLLDEMSELLKVAYDEQSEVAVVFHDPKQRKEAIRFSVPTVFDDRAKKIKEGFVRAEGVQNVRKNVEEHFEGKEFVPDSTILRQSVTFEQLMDKGWIDYNQLEDASKNKLGELAYKNRVFQGVLKNGAAFIAKEFTDLIQDFPSKEMNSMETLKVALKERITKNNVQMEKIGKKAFHDLIHDLKGKQVNAPPSLFYAPEYGEAFKAFNDNSWPEGLEKEFNLMEIPNDNLKSFMEVIDAFFEDETVVKALKQFMPEI